MEEEINLPFKEGQLVESRSFAKGYRGSWFKCKIINISKRRGRLGHVLKYLDFPGEKLKWRMLYHVSLHQEGDTKEKHRELILRPPYPPIYDEEQMPHLSEISEVAVIVGDSWRVGDLVDWWTTGYYWSGRITQLLGHKKAKIELNPAPLGEGDAYTVLLKDLRPTLDWFPKHGWILPTQEGADRPCARLIKPINQDETKSRTTQSASQKMKDRLEGSPSNEAVDNSTSLVVADSKQNIAEVKSRTTATRKWKDRQERSPSKEAVVSSMSLAVADSEQNINEMKSRTTNTKTQIQTQTLSEKQERSTEPAALAAATEEKDRAILHSKHCDTLEAAILDLEEYVNKVKWLKKLLQNGTSSPDDDERPQWTFMEPFSALETPK